MPETISTTHTIAIDGKMVDFPRITVNQIHSACQQVEAARETNARNLAKEMKLSQNELFNVIFEIRARKVTGAELLSLCEVPGIAIKIVELSFANNPSGYSGDPISSIIDKISYPDLTGLAKALILELEPEKIEPSDDEKKEGETQSPLDGGSGVSTTETPIPSDTASTSTTTTVLTGKGPMLIPAGYGSNP